MIITGSNTASIQACMRLKRRYANHPGCGKAYTSANGLKQHLIAHQGKTHCCDELSFNPISTHTGKDPMKLGYHHYPRNISMEKHKRARVKALAKIAKQLHSGVNYSAPFQCQTSGELKDMRAITQ